MAKNIKQNYLSPLEFQFTINRLPYTEFFTQGANVPGLTLNPVEVPTPFKPTYFSSDSATYNDLTLSIRVDENMQSYREIYNWMLGLAFPDNFEQFANLKASDEGVYSDATLVIVTNGKAPNIRIVYKDIYPISLGDIPMMTTSQDVDPIVVDVTFKTNGHEIRVID